MMLKNFMGRLQKEWTLVTSAPAAFIMVIVLAALLVFFMVNRRYEGVVRSLTEAQNTRIQIRDAQLDEYRERLLLLPGSGSGLSGVGNKELKHTTLTLVDELREFISRYKQEEKTVSDSLRSGIMKAESADEKNRFLEFHNNTLSLFILRRNAEYDRRFKIEAVLLRDELLSRLPEDAKNGRVFDGYEYPVNPAGIEMIADDLHRMAELLN